MGQGKTESYIIVCKKIDKNINFFFLGSLSRRNRDDRTKRYFTSHCFVLSYPVTDLCMG